MRSSVRRILTWAKYFWLLTTSITGAIRIITNLSMSLTTRATGRRRKSKTKRFRGNPT
jgi:hypothetical protein